MPKAKQRKAEQRAALKPRTDPKLQRRSDDSRRDALRNWFVTGHAIGQRTAEPGEIVIGEGPARPIARLSPGGIDSGLLSIALQGEARSPSFTIDKKFVHFRLAGRNARVNLVIDGYTLIMNPMYGKLTIAPASDRLVWRTMPVDRWVGHRAYIEVSDSTIPPHGLNPPPSPARMPSGPDGYLAVEQIVFSDDPTPPLQASTLNQEALHERAVMQSPLWLTHMSS